MQQRSGIQHRPGITTPTADLVTHAVLVFTGKAQAFNDLHLCDVSNPDEYKWSTVHAVNSPPPRARHTATMVRLLPALHMIRSSALHSFQAIIYHAGTCTLRRLLLFIMQELP